MTHQLLDSVHTRACTGLKDARNSVTVQNRTHVYRNFFDHKDLGNHLLQLCPKVVKHPVYIAKMIYGPSSVKKISYLGGKQVRLEWPTHLVYQPNAEDHLYSVVNNQHVLEVKWLTVLHPAGSRGKAEVMIRDEDRQKWHRPTYEHPVLCARICNMAASHMIHIQ